MLRINEIPTPITMMEKSRTGFLPSRKSLAKLNGLSSDFNRTGVSEKLVNIITKPQMPIPPKAVPARFFVAKEIEIVTDIIRNIVVRNEINRRPSELILNAPRGEVRIESKMETIVHPDISTYRKVTFTRMNVLRVIGNERYVRIKLFSISREKLIATIMGNAIVRKYDSKVKHVTI